MFPDISVEKIAMLLHMNRSYLSRYFKQNYGMTIQDYLIQTRLYHASRLLKTGATVQDTANMVGYLDAFNFSKIFKKNTGVSPSVYRTNHQNEP